MSSQQYDGISSLSYVGFIKAGRVNVLLPRLACARNVRVPDRNHRSYLARNGVARVFALLSLLFLSACGTATTSGISPDSLAMAGKPHGIVYFSITDFCSWSQSGIALSFWKEGGAVDVSDSAGKQLRIKKPATGFASVFFKELSTGTQIFRYELPPGNYSVRSLYCVDIQERYHRKKNFIVKDLSKTFWDRVRSGRMPDDKRIGVGYFTVKNNEVISAGSLNAENLQIPGMSTEFATLKVRTFNKKEMQIVQQLYPNEASKIVYRPVWSLPGIAR